MLNTIEAFFLRNYHGAPVWAFAALALLLVGEWALGKYHPTSKSTLALTGALLKAVLYGVGFLLQRFPATAPLMDLAKSLLKIGVFVAFFVGLSGCAHGVAGGYQAEANFANAADAAQKAFLAFDRDYQMQIVADGKKAGKSADAIEADLQAYRHKRAAVNKAFADAGAVILSGHAVLPLVEKGIAKDKDMNDWLSSLFAASTELREALAAIGVNLGGK